MEALEPTLIKKYPGTPGSAGIGPVALLSLFLLSLWQMFLRAQNPGLMSDDSGEMAAASYQLGLPHPPGYPLFCLIGRLTCLLPLGTPAFRLNLLSQFFLMGSLLVLLGLWKRITRPAKLGWGWMIGTTGLAMVLVSNQDLFSQALTAKGGVYTLTLFFTCLCVWFISEGDESTNKRTLFLIFFVWSLGLANHWQTHLVWIPFLIGWMFHHRTRWNLKTLVMAMSWVAIGMSLYLYLPLRGTFQPLPFWGNPVQWEGFKWVVTRQLVSGFEPLTLHWDFYRSFFGMLPGVYFTHWFPGFLIGLLPGIYYLAREQGRLLSGIGILCFSVLGAVALVHEPKNTYLTPLYLLSLLGLAWLVASFGWWRWIERMRMGKFAVLLMLFLAQCLWLYQVYNREEKSRYHLAEDFAENVLQALPENSIMIAEGDHYVMGIWYELYGRGKRPDLAFEPGVFLVHDWGWRQIARQNKDWSNVASSPFSGKD